MTPLFFGSISVILSQHEIDYVPVDKVNIQPNFQKLASQPYAFQIDPETMDLIKGDEIDFTRLAHVFQDLIAMACEMSKSDLCAIQPKDVVIFDDGQYKDGFINFSKGRRRKVNARQPLSITEHQFHVFENIISNGDCKIDQIRFLLKIDNDTKSGKSGLLGS